MTTEKRLTITEARAVLLRHGVVRTSAAVIRWCKEYGIGVQMGGVKGQWRVDKDKLLEFIGEDK